MNNSCFKALILVFSCLAFAACQDKEDASQRNLPAAPATTPPIDTSAMVKPLDADSQHLKTPVLAMPDTGRMPVVPPEPGLVPK